MQVSLTIKMADYVKKKGSSVKKYQALQLCFVLKAYSD
jgi:hypothetical protein